MRFGERGHTDAGGRRSDAGWAPPPANCWTTTLALWDDLVVLMRAGVRAGRIVTTRPEDRPPGRASGRARREDSFYVYRRTGLPCRICNTPVQTAVMAARNLFWCATDQQE